jgi:hypothetical protein
MLIYNEGQLGFQKTYDVEFVEIENGKDLTKNEMEIACIGVQASQFMRVEDVDYQKGSDANEKCVFCSNRQGPDTGVIMIGDTQIRIRPYYAYTRKLTQIIGGNTDTM